MRQSSLDGLTSTGRTGYGRSGGYSGNAMMSANGGGGMVGNMTNVALGANYGYSKPRASSSETNLRKLAMNDPNRPGSALGLLQGKKRQPVSA